MTDPGDGLMHVIDMLGALDMQRKAQIAELEARVERAEEMERQAVLAATEAMNGKARVPQP